MQTRMEKLADTAYISGRPLNQLTQKERLALAVTDFRYRMITGGITGWIDAGNASTEAVRFLININRKVATPAAHEVSSLLDTMYHALLEYADSPNYDFAAVLQHVHDGDFDEKGSLFQQPYESLSNTFETLEERFGEVSEAWVKDVDKHYFR